MRTKNTEKDKYQNKHDNFTEVKLAVSIPGRRKSVFYIEKYSKARREKFDNTHNYQKNTKENLARPEIRIQNKTNKKMQDMESKKGLIR